MVKLASPVSGRSESTSVLSVGGKKQELHRRHLDVIWVFQVLVFVLDVTLALVVTVHRFLGLDGE